MTQPMGHLAAKGIVEDYFDTLSDVRLGLRIPQSPAFTSIQSLLGQNVHKKKLPPRIKASLEKRFSIGLKLRVEKWSKDMKLLAGNTPCFSKKWQIVDGDDQVLFEEASVVLFYLGFMAKSIQDQVFTHGDYTVHSSVGQHALVRMLQRSATTAEGLAETAHDALYQAALLADFAGTHSEVTKSNYWKRTHTVALPFKGGALILVSHYLAGDFAGFDNRNYSVRTWLSADQLKDEVQQSMAGWDKLMEAKEIDIRPDYLDRLFLPKDFSYD